MTGKLPIPGANNGAWGQLLNEFLTVALDPETGLLRPHTQLAATIGDFSDVVDARLRSRPLSPTPATADTLLGTRASDGALVRTSPPALLRAVRGEYSPLAARYGGIFDGTHHPLSERFGAGVPGLTAAQAAYPFATDVAQSIDWAAVQLAQDDAEADGGGAVVLPPRVGIIGRVGGVTDAVLLGDNVALVGVGPASCLRRADNAHSAPLIWNKGRATANGGTGLGNVNIIVHNLRLDGNKGTATAFASNQQGLWLTRVTNPSVTRVWSHDQRTDGIVIDGCRDGVVDGNFTYRNLKDGLYLSASDNITGENVGWGNGSTTGPALIGASLAIAACWYCNLGGAGRGDASPSLLIGRDSQYCQIGGNWDGVEGIAEVIGAGTLPYAADHPGRTGAYDGVTTYGVSNSRIAVTTRGVGRNAARFFKSHNNLLDIHIPSSSLNGVYLWGSSGNVVRGKAKNLGLGSAIERHAVVVLADSTFPLATNNIIDVEVDDDQATPTSAGLNIAQQGTGDVSGTQLRGFRVPPVVTPALTLSPISLAVHRQGTALGITAPQRLYGTAAPTTGTYARGDMLLNTAPTSGAPWAWLCVAAGTPGTWVPLVGGGDVVQTPAFASVYTPDMALGNIVTLTLSGPLTIALPTGGVAGQLLTFILTQDATGGRAVTWSSGYKRNWTPDTTAGKVNTIVFRCVSPGANWTQVGGVTGI